jgi:hypothetical protein
MGGRRFVGQASGASGYLEQYTLGALKIDVGHNTVAGLVESMDAVVVRHETKPSAQKVAGGLLHAVALHGAAEYEAHRARVAAYPDELARKMVTQHLFFMPTWAVERQALDSGDLFAFYSLLCDVVGNLMGVLAGLNRVYYAVHPGPKWTEWHLDQMRRKPEGTPDAITKLLATPSHETMADLYGVIEEAVGLVEAHMPEVDTATARAVLGFGMEACEERPERVKP